MNSFNALPSVNPEVQRSPEQKSGWDDVAVLPKEESWENHVKKAIALKESTNIDSETPTHERSIDSFKNPEQRESFTDMKPLQIVENLDKLSNQGIKIDMNKLLSTLNAPEQFIYMKELNQYGANLDEDKIADQATESELDMMDAILANNMSATKDSFKKLLDIVNDGASFSKISSLLTAKELYDNTGTLLTQGVSNGDISFMKAGLCLEENNYREAKRNIVEWNFGTNYNNVCSELVAFGALGPSNPDDSFDMARSFTKYDGDYKFSKTNMDNLNDLIDNGELNGEDAEIIATAIDLVTEANNNQEISEAFNFFKGKIATLDRQNMGNILTDIRKHLCDKCAKNYSEYMTKTIEFGTRDVGTISAHHLVLENGTHVDRDIQVKRMEGDEFIMLVHRLGAYSDNDKSSPEAWDTRTPDTYDEDGNPIGYVSTAVIGDQSLDVAPRGPEKDGVYYAFTDLPKNSFEYSATYDLFTVDSTDGTKTRNQDVFYTNPRTIVQKTRDRMESIGEKIGHNEVALNRFPEGSSSAKSRLHPNYLVVFSGSNDPAEISEQIKDHAAYFNVPIMLIDPNKYGRSKNGTSTNA